MGLCVKSPLSKARMALSRTMRDRDKSSPRNPRTKEQIEVNEIHLQLKDKVEDPAPVVHVFLLTSGQENLWRRIQCPKRRMCKV